MHVLECEEKGTTRAGVSGHEVVHLDDLHHPTRQEASRASRLGVGQNPGTDRANGPNRWFAAHILPDTRPMQLGQVAGLPRDD